MEQNYALVRTFLENPSASAETFWESQVLVWVDWREEDEYIVKYFNACLPEKDKIGYECVDCDKPRGIDILLKGKGVDKAIPYASERLDRNTTINAIQEFLAPDYQIRLYIESLGGDTLAFCLLSVGEWTRLEDEYSTRTVARYFEPVRPECSLF